MDIAYFLEKFNNLIELFQNFQYITGILTGVFLSKKKFFMRIFMLNIQFNT